MKHEAAIWLPDEAIAHHGLTAATQRCLDAWSEHWLVRARASAGGGKCWTTANGESQHSTQGESHPLIQLAIHGDGRAAVGAAMLGRRFPDPAMRPADLRLLEELAHPCLADLSDRFAALLSLPPATQALDVRFAQSAKRSGELAISLDGHPPIGSLFVSLENLFLMLRALLPPPRARRQPDPVVDAIADCPVELAALVGHAQIAIPDLDRLEIGDVIIVDRPIDERLDLFVNNRRCGNSAVDIALNETSLQLRIIEAPSQWQD